MNAELGRHMGSTEEGRKILEARADMSKIPVGSLIEHTAKGQGIVIKIDEHKRMHLKFKNNEVHKYNPTSWHKMKLIKLAKEEDAWGGIMAGSLDEKKRLAVKISVGNMPATPRWVARPPRSDRRQSWASRASPTSLSEARRGAGETVGLTTGTSPHRRKRGALPRWFRGVPYITRHTPYITRHTPYITRHHYITRHTIILHARHWKPKHCKPSQLVAQAFRRCEPQSFCFVG